MRPAERIGAMDAQTARGAGGTETMGMHVHDRLAHLTMTECSHLHAPTKCNPQSEDRRSSCSCANPWLYVDSICVALSNRCVWTES